MGEPDTSLLHLANEQDSCILGLAVEVDGRVSKHTTGYVLWAERVTTIESLLQLK
jgi:hypothetical protein